MQTFRIILAALIALALLPLSATVLTAAPELPRTALRAHSDAWHDFYFDRNGATHLTLDITETPRATWRGGLAEQRAVPPVPAPRPAVRVAHGADWDAHYFDRNISKSIKTSVSFYESSLLWQGCHAQADHRVQPASVLVSAQH
jgi:hypothetical protein